MRIPVMVTVVLAIAGMAMAEQPEREEFPSPDGKWKIVAHWNANRCVCLFDLLNTRNGRVYFDESSKISDEKEGFPQRVNAVWSPGGDYAALNLYYGRLLQGVVIVDVTGVEPAMQVFSLPDKFLKGRPPLFFAEKWLNGTDLALSGEYESDAHLIARITDHKVSIIQRTGTRDQYRPRAYRMKPQRSEKGQ